MGQKPDSSLSDQFLKHLRGSLNHLYDHEYLRQSPLAVLFGVAGRFDTPAALQRLLTHAIEELEPDTIQNVHERRIYEILFYRYIHQLNQDEIAHQLGISVRQLHREQNAAIYILGSKMWEEYRLGDLLKAEAEQSPAFSEAAATVSESNEAIRDLAWLKTVTGIHTDLNKTLPVVVQLIQPLIEQHHVLLHLEPSEDCLLGVHPVAFQQILLNVLSLAIHCSPPGKFLLAFARKNRSLEVSVACSEPASLPPDDIRTLTITQQMVEMCQGNLTISGPAEPLQVKIIFPMVQQVQVLVVEDNAEIVALMQRFAFETRFSITGLDDPGEAIPQIERLQPHIVILDIMIPQVDGLQILSQIKHHPALTHTPVIVCSVLPQKDLAFSLGANDFLQKPFQRDRFIAVLETQAQAIGG